MVGCRFLGPQINSMSDPEELFDIVDELDVVIGSAPRGECHGNPTLIHRSVHVLVFNKAG